MKSQLVLYISMVSFTAFTQTTKLKNSSTVNEFEVKFEKNADGDFEIYITDSKNNEISQRLSEKNDTPVSLINRKVIKKIMDSSKGFHYLIPSTKVAVKPDVNQNDINQDIVVMAIKKLEKKEFQEFLKSRIIYNNPANKNNYKDYLSTLKNVNDSKSVFSGNSTIYQIKKTATSKIELFKNTISISEINSESEDTFLEKLYEDCKDNDDVLKTLFTNEDLKIFKSVDYATNENMKSLEEIYDKLQGKEKILNYSYLGYIGTNFDLVDGAKAKNLFFATNIMVTPKSYERIGFYISLYGNRTLSRIDSIPYIIRDSKVIDSIGNQYLIKEKSDVVKKIESDNLGAFCSPLFRCLKKFWGSSSSLYFAPSLEFIWRRTSVDVQYTDSQDLSPELQPFLTPSYNNNLSYRQKNTYNIYDFYIAPIGFWLLHENNIISIRLNMNTGYSSRYAPNNYLNTSSDFDLISYSQDTYKNSNDFFYTGKLWITERTSGITIEAEINNTFKHPTPFYGVTLSKAFDLDKLGIFFKPISTKINGNATP